MSFLSVCRKKVFIWTGSFVNRSASKIRHNAVMREKRAYSLEVNPLQQSEHQIKSVCLNEWTLCTVYRQEYTYVLFC